jgi:hypothetical protein
VTERTETTRCRPLRSARSPKVARTIRAQRRNSRANSQSDYFRPVYDDAWFDEIIDLWQESGSQGNEGGSRAKTCPKREEMLKAARRRELDNHPRLAPRTDLGMVICPLLVIVAAATLPLLISTAGTES